MPQAQVDTSCQPEQDVLMRVFLFFNVNFQRFSTPYPEVA